MILLQGLHCACWPDWATVKPNALVSSIILNGYTLTWASDWALRGIPDRLCQTHGQSAKVADGLVTLFSPLHFYDFLSKRPRPTPIGRANEFQLPPVQIPIRHANSCIVSSNTWPCYGLAHTYGPSCLSWPTCPPGRLYSSLAFHPPFAFTRPAPHILCPPHYWIAHLLQSGFLPPVPGPA